MEYTLGHYQDKEYINYIDEDGKVCDNLHYFSIDVLSGAFQKIMFTEDGIPKVGGSAVHVHAVGQDLVQLPLAGRDGHGLERTGVHGVELIPAFDLEHPAVAARADEALDAPLAEERLIPLVILVFHADPSSYFSACSAVFGQNARQTAADRAKAPNFLVFPQIARHKMYALMLSV